MIPDSRYESVVGSSGISSRGSSVCSTSSSSSALGSRSRVEVAERRVARLELDPDVEHVAVLALAGAEQLEVLDEAGHGRGRQLLGGVLVADLVVEPGHGSDEVRGARHVDVLEREPAGARHEQVVAAVGVAAGLADLGHGPDARHGQARGRARLEALADEHDPERRAGLDAVAGQRPVAVLEDVERHDDAGAQDGVERKEGQFHRRGESTTRIKNPPVVGPAGFV